MHISHDHYLIRADGIRYDKRLVSMRDNSPFAPSGSNFLNFKLPIESGTQSQPLQDILL
jgi:hypothetical protein